MIKSTPFKSTFIFTIILLSTILLFLITDHNTKNLNFRNSPSIFKIENVHSEYYNIELLGNKFKISPLKPNINSPQKLIFRALIPKKLKLIENFLCSSYAAYNDFSKYKKNIEYLENTQ